MKAISKNQEKETSLLADAPVLDMVTIAGMESLLNICSVVVSFCIAIKAWVVTAHDPWYLENKSHHHFKNSIKLYRLMVVSN